MYRLGYSSAKNSLSDWWLTQSDVAIHVGNGCAGVRASSAREQGVKNDWDPDGIRRAPKADLRERARRAREPQARIISTFSSAYTLLCDAARMMCLEISIFVSRLTGIGKSSFVWLYTVCNVGRYWRSRTSISEHLWSGRATVFTRTGIRGQRRVGVWGLCPLPRLLPSEWWEFQEIYYYHACPRTVRQFKNPYTVYPWLHVLSPAKGIRRCAYKSNSVNIRGFMMIRSLECCIIPLQILAGLYITKKHWAYFLAKYVVYITVIVRIYTLICELNLVKIYQISSFLNWIILKFWRCPFSLIFWPL